MFNDEDIRDNEAGEIMGCCGMIGFYELYLWNLPYQKVEDSIEYSSEDNEVINNPSAMFY